MLVYVFTLYFVSAASILKGTVQRLQWATLTMAFHVPTFDVGLATFIDALQWILTARGVVTGGDGLLTKFCGSLISYCYSLIRILIATELTFVRTILALLFLVSGKKSSLHCLGTC